MKKKMIGRLVRVIEPQVGLSCWVHPWWHCL